MYTNISSEAPSSAQQNTGYANDTKTGRYYNEAEKSTEKTATSSGGYDSSQVTEPKATKPLPHYLTQAFEIQTAEGKTYRVYPYVTKEQAVAIEHQSGIILPIPDRNPNTTKRIPAYQGEDLSGYLGGGAYGRVYVGEVLTETRQPTGQFCAVKIIIGDPAKVAESAHEAAIQKQLTQNQAPETSHLMPLIAAVEEREGGVLNRLYYLLPLAALGNVETLRQQLNTLENKELKRLVCWHIGQGLLLGLWQMHKQGIYHLDVKLGNLLVNGQGKVLVADFGTSEKIEARPPLLTPHRDEHGRFVGNGDSTYFPPERTHDSAFDAVQADVYAAGLALWELATGDSIESIDDYDEPANVLRAIEQMSQNSLADVARHLIHRDPKQRWTLEQALNHPIFQAPDLHDSASMSVVLDFLKRFVQQVQLQARDAQHQVSVNELAQSALTLRQSPAQTTEDEQAIKLSQLLNPFAQRPDVQEQLQLYLPLQGSYARVVKDPKTDNFDLSQETQIWLNDPNSTLLLLLADGGSGKSLFTQQLTTHLLQTITNNNTNAKPWLPLYIVLSGIRHPENLLQEGLGLSKDELKALEKGYQLLLILDGYDEQQHWTNLYVQNQLHQYPLKIIITSRLNALPPIYRPFFEPQVPGEPRPRALKEIYVQPFNAKQIESYILNYVSHQQSQLQAEVTAQRLGKEWLDVNIYQTQVNNTPGLKELIQIPLLCRLSLEALPELANRSNNNNVIQQRITRAQVYEAFMTRWVHQQMLKHTQPLTLKQVFALGQRTALSLYQDQRAAQVNGGIAQFYFDAQTGHYQQQARVFDWFFQAKLERECLPLQEVSKGQYKFMHFSMQEFLLARHLYQQLKATDHLKNLDWNKLLLTIEEKDHLILYFLGNFAQMDLDFQNQLFQLIEQTKTDKSQARSGANAITVLNAAGIQLNNKDFKGIAIPNANLSGMVSDGSDWSQADLSNVNLQSAWLRGSRFQQAQLRGIRFYEYPYIQEKDRVNVMYSAKHFFVVAAGNEIKFYDANTRQLLHVLQGHTGGVTSVSVLGDGQTLVSGSYDRTVRVWDSKHGQLLHTLQGHTSWVTSVSVLEDGQTLVSGSDDHTLRVWDAKHGQLLYTLEGHTWYVTSLSALGDGQTLVSGSGDRTLRVWDAKHGQLLHILQGHTDGVTSVHVLGDGQTLVSGSGDRTLRVWDAKHGQLLHTLQGHTGGVTSLNVLRDGQTIISGSYDNTVRVWDAKQGQLLHTLQGHTSYVNSISVLGDGQTLVSGSGDKTVRVWDAKHGQLLHTLQGHTDGVTSVHVLGDGQTLVSGSSDCTLRVWDAKHGQLLHTLQGHTNKVTSLSILGDEQTLVSGGCTLRVWDSKYGQLLHTLQGHTDEVTSLSVLGDGQTLVSGGYTLRVWDAKQGRLLHILRGHTGVVRSLSILGDGQTLVSGSYDESVRVWDAKQGRLLHTLRGHTDEVRSLSVLGDGQTFISGSYDKTVRVWDAKQGQLLHVLQGHTDKVSSISVLRDGRTIVSGSYDKTVRVWDGKQGLLLHTLQGHTSEVWSVNVLGDGQTIVSGSRDKTVRVWDSQQGQLLHVLQGHTNSVNSVSVLGDGHTLVSGSWDKTVRLWNVKSGQCLQVISLPQPIERMVLQRVQSQDRLVVSFGTTVACFNIKSDFTFSLQWLASGNAQLFLQGVDITNTRRLDETNKALFKQQGAIGEPAMLENDELQTNQTEDGTAVTNNNSKLAFQKPALNSNTPLSLLFTQPKTSISQASFQQWAQTVKAQGAWTVEREGQNLRIAFDPQHKSTNMTLLLTQLRSHLSQLPEWQHVVAQQQEGNALLIRLNSEANAQAYEVPLKQALGIEEFKLTQSCVVS